MAYQALLFCPDEKTARTVTQVLNDLEFEVNSCTEPFAAVKKLMAERFDAVVVDCDNEQNATLLFKSARNAPNNHSALAVAVVEGQAGVAKAFRIGANLVLTKPINVEQAKGTLRVARGLLRKNETAKSAPASPAATKPAAQPPRTSPTPLRATPGPVAHADNAVPPASPAPAPSQRMQPVMRDSASASTVEPEEILDVNDDKIEQPVLGKASTSPARGSAPATTQPVVELPVAKPSIAAKPQAITPPITRSASPSGTASAPAPALEPKSGPALEKTSSSQQESPVAIPENPLPSAQRNEVSFLPAEPQVTEPSTLPSGIAEEAEKKPAGGNKIALLTIVVLLLVAAAGYAAWTQFGHPQATPSSPAPVPQRPAANPTVPPQSSINTANTQSPANTLAPSSSSPVSDASSAKMGATAATAIKTSPTPDADSKAAEPAKPNSSMAKPTASPESTSKVEAAQPIAVKSGTSKKLSNKIQTNDAPAPTLGSIQTAQNNPALPNLMSTSNGAPVPVLQTTLVSQGVSEGLVIKRVSPSYPQSALRLRIEGSVQLLATITKNGDISAVKVLSGDSNLARAAVDAVKQWKYKPYLLDGSPVEMQTQVTIKFKLPR